MAMKIKYVGDFAEVEVPDLQLVVKRGESVDVSDEQGLAMIKQVVWETAGSSPASLANPKSK